MKRFGCLSCCLNSCCKKLNLNYSLCQRLNLTQQLQDGVRYLDFTLAFLEDGTEPTTPDENHARIRVFQGLYGNRLEDEIKVIKDFLNANPKEVIIFHLQDFHDQNWTVERKRHAWDLLFHGFGSKLAPRPDSMDTFTLKHCWEMSYQVVCPTKSWWDVPEEQSKVLWNEEETIETIWPQTTRLTTLQRHLDREKQTNLEAFHVSQGVLTPDCFLISCNVCSTLEKTCADPALIAVVGPWLDAMQSSEDRNIIMVDFVEKENFCERVLRLNTLDEPAQEENK